MSPLVFGQIAVCAFFGILFIQSGLDKITDRKGNLEWLTGHFAKSPFRGMVPLLLSVITVFEVCAGIASSLGALIWVISIFNLEFARSLPQFVLALPFYGLCLSATSLLMLFFGQRFAKDYVGAATIATYFGVVLAGFILLSQRGR